MFYKVIYHNLEERKREVYLMSVFEDQIPKWENCLEPSDEIQSYDRTYKLIKEKLLRAVIERSKKLESIQENDQSAMMINLDNEADFQWGEDDNMFAQDVYDGDEDGGTPFMRYRESKRKMKATHSKG